MGGGISKVEDARAAETLVKMKQNAQGAQALTNSQLKIQTPANPSSQPYTSPMSTPGAASGASSTTGTGGARRKRQSKATRRRRKRNGRK